MGDVLILEARNYRCKSRDGAKRGETTLAMRGRDERSSSEFRATKNWLVLKYRGTIRVMKQVTRVQTGVRLEERLLKVLKALASQLDMSLGDLIEGIALHAFEGKAPFSSATLKKIKALKTVYGLDLTAEDSHNLGEADGNA